MDTQKLRRDLLKAGLRPLIRWRPHAPAKDGFSIIVGTPWALRHLLSVNLRFVALADLRGLDRVHVVFDRVRQGGGEAEALMSRLREAFPQLSLTFEFHDAVAGRLIGWINQSKFYASMNWVQGLRACRTRYAILHDFDLYPLVPHYFTAIVDAMRQQPLRFSGLEYTHFDGLRDGHRLIGTWALGIDVDWLRRHWRPIDCFHAVTRIDGRRFDVDAFSYIQSRTAERRVTASLSPADAAHVKNLCSTYLRFTKGESPPINWRLHYLWYLEELAGVPQRLTQLTRQMQAAAEARLTVDGQELDFREADVTCANVLRDGVQAMERVLYGECRPAVRRYLDAFEAFLGGNVPAAQRPEGAIS